MKKYKLLILILCLIALFCTTGCGRNEEWVDLNENNIVH